MATINPGRFPEFNSKRPRPYWLNVKAKPKHEPSGEFQKLLEERLSGQSQPSKTEQSES